MAVKKLLVIAILVGACSDPTSEPVADGGADAVAADAQVDAIPVDADLDATDAAPSSCPNVDPPATSSTDLPTGKWRGRWACVAECTQPAASPIVAATSVVVGAGDLTWRPQVGAATVTPAAAVGSSWVVAQVDEPCTGSFALRQTSVATTCGGSPCVFVQFASFMTASGRWQVWEFRGTR